MNTEPVASGDSLATEVNALPKRLRSYIHDLETNCDPSGIVRENFLLREMNKGLRAECERLAANANGAVGA